MPAIECPICGQRIVVATMQDAPYRPFCCYRCKMVDLGRWLDGTYRVGEPAADDLNRTATELDAAE